MAAEQPPPSGQSLLGAIRGYAVLVIMVLAAQIILAFFIIRTVIIGRQENTQQAGLEALEALNEPEEEVALPDKPAEIYDIKDDILTNAANTDRVRFVKTHFQLGVTPKKVTEEILLIEPKVIDTILCILSSKTVSELDDPAEKEVIKDEVKIALNKYLSQGEVVKVYITYFLVQ